MITDAREFRPLQPPRLVPSPGVELDGPGTRFAAGDLVDESALRSGRTGWLMLVQLADNNR